MTSHLPFSICRRISTTFAFRLDYLYRPARNNAHTAGGTGTGARRFAISSSAFEIAILEVGRRDAEWAEVLSGLSLGQTYVADNSFVIKADIGKSGATHDH